MHECVHIYTHTDKAWLLTNLLRLTKAIEFNPACNPGEDSMDCSIRIPISVMFERSIYLLQDEHVYTYIYMHIYICIYPVTPKKIEKCFRDASSKMFSP